MTPKAQRVASLDVLRGFDLFLLVFFQPVCWALCSELGLPWLDGLLYQLDHEVWEGFRFWDLVMPLFLFITGCSLPFSLAKLEHNKQAYFKIFKRVAILFLLGMVVQGNLLSLDVHHIYIYTNTLQAIAVGYLIAALIQLNMGRKAQVAAAVGLLFVYWLPMTFCGDYSMQGNFANKVDALILGRFRGDPSYTWIWSSLTFGVTVLLGSFAGQFIKGHASEGKRVYRGLALIGLCLTAAGLLWSLQHPIIKRLWTGSMTLFAGGLCFLLLALCYYVVDYKGCRNLDWLKIYGMNSIVAYMLGEVVNFRSLAHSLFHGLQQYMGGYYPVWLTFCNFLILFFILRLMYKQKIFIKV